MLCETKIPKITLWGFPGASGPLTAGLAGLATADFNAFPSNAWKFEFIKFQG